MSSLTSHVLDTAAGTPARGMAARLEVLEAGGWRLLAQRVTNDDGRITDWLPAGALQALTYRVTFQTGAYLRASGRPVFYPHVEVVFTVSAPAEHHHIPLLLSPFGYSTYRGS
jgi:5-hydroxyisourate hydrolase